MIATDGNNSTSVTRPLSGQIALWLLGAWLGASLTVFAVGYQNFAGLPGLLERNPALAQRAGFDPKDDNAKRSSLLWVHASEQNRVLFGAWVWVQLALGGAAALALLRARAGYSALAALLALALVVYLGWRIIPDLTRQGRALDFVSRTPPPPELAAFGRVHAVSFGLDLLRAAFVLAAAVPLIRRRRT
jgi:hypothetical protein